MVRRGVERRGEHGRGQRAACPRSVRRWPAGRGPVPLVGGVPVINFPLLDSLTLSATWTITEVTAEQRSSDTAACRERGHFLSVPAFISDPSAQHHD